MTHYQRKFFVGFLLALAVVFSPFNGLGYVISFLFVGLFLFEGYPLVKEQNSKTTIWIILVLFSCFVFYKTIYSDIFNEQGFLMSALTYSSFLPLFYLRREDLANEELLMSLGAVCKKVLLLESVIGIIQAAYGFVQSGSLDVSNGDHVEGTIHLALPSELSFSNPMFSINVLFLLLIVMVYEVKRARWTGLLPVLLGVFSVILASVMHQIGLFVFSIILSLMFVPREVSQANPMIMRLRKVYLYAVTLVGALAALILGSNVSQMSGVLTGLFTQEDIPKALVTKNTLVDLAEEVPISIFIGLGPGQYSSQAALISSGYFFGGPSNPKTLPLLTPTENYYSDKYILKVMTDFADVSYIGSTQMPYYSFLSVYGELGLVGFIFLLLIPFKAVKSIRSLMIKNPSILNLQIGISSISICFFIFFLGIQVNYYEVPQAIFMGILIYILLSAQLLIKNERPDTSIEVLN